MTNEAPISPDEIIRAFRSGDDEQMAEAAHRLLTNLTYAGPNEKWDHHANVAAWLGRRSLLQDVDNGSEGDYDEGTFGDGSRECSNCDDEVSSLSSRLWCDGCEKRDATPKCDQCDTRDGDADHLGNPIELNRWPNLKDPVQLCPSCTHDARRNGWEPGQ